MRATIKIIAERAGVSIGTVDRVLHDRPYVKEEVRRRVLEVMEELDYRPNRMASALATSGLTRQFAIIQPTWESYVGAAMAAGVEKFRRERQDYNVHVTVYPYPQGQTETCLRLLDQAAEETQGIALCAADCPPVRQKLEELAERRVPVVTFNSDIAGGKRLCGGGRPPRRPGGRGHRRQVPHPRGPDPAGVRRPRLLRPQGPGRRLSGADGGEGLLPGGLPGGGDPRRL